MTKRGAQRARGRRKAERRMFSLVARTGPFGWTNTEVALDESGVVVLLSAGRPVAWMSPEVFNSLVSA